MQPELGRPGAPAPRISLRTGSALRLAAELVVAPVAFVTGLMTAKSLGPDGKGVLATMSYVGILFAGAGGLGLGEAGITLGARRVRDLQAALASTLGALLVSSTVAVGLFVLASYAQYHEHWNVVTTPVLAIAGCVPLVLATSVLTLFLLARERYVSSAVARVGLAVVSAGATYLLVIVGRWDLNGAAIAFSLGWIVSGAITLVGLRIAGFRLRPTFDRRYLGVALRLGAPIGFSTLLTALATRIDLVIVNGLDGVVSAGQYSVALTISSLVTYAPAILTNSSYPRLAGLDDAGYLVQIARLSRLCVLVTGGASLVLAAMVPFVVPGLFGPGYRGSVAPALWLLAGEVLWAAQWALCRGRAARGDGRLLVRSFVTSVGVMIGADLLLVPAWGATGAAVGFLIGGAAGMSLVLRAFGRDDDLAWRSLLVPRGGDVHDLRDVAADAVRPVLALLRRGGPVPQ